MEPRTISALEAVRDRLEEDLGLTKPLRDLVTFTEAEAAKKKYDSYLLKAAEKDPWVKANIDDPLVQFMYGDPTPGKDTRTPKQKWKDIRKSKFFGDDEFRQKLGKMWRGRKKVKGQKLKKGQRLVFGRVVEPEFYDLIKKAFGGNLPEWIEDVGEALEPREATRARLRAIAQRTRAAEGGKKVEPREASRERFRAIAQRTGAAKPKKKLKPGEKMVFGKVVKSSIDPETADTLTEIRNKLEADFVGESKVTHVVIKANRGGDYFASALDSKGRKVKSPLDGKTWGYSDEAHDAAQKAHKKATVSVEHVEVAEAKGAEKVACAVSGALNLKKGQKGDKKKLAKEIAKRTKSKKVARKAMKMAQEF